MIWSPMKKQDLMHAARGGESSSPDLVLNIVTKKCVQKPNEKKKKKKLDSAMHVYDTAE